MPITGSSGSSEIADEDVRREAARRRAAGALLRDHPDAMIFAQSAEGQIVPVPSSLGLDGHTLLEEAGRTGADLCVAEDRMAVVNAWIEVKREGVAEVRARLRSDPHVWRVVRMLDVRRCHGVILTIGWVGEQDQVDMPRGYEAAVSSAPRFATRKQDSEGNVIECDEAYLQMFGLRARSRSSRAPHLRACPCRGPGTADRELDRDGRDGPPADGSRA